MFFSLDDLDEFVLQKVSQELRESFIENECHPESNRVGQQCTSYCYVRGCPKHRSDNIPNQILNDRIKAHTGKPDIKTCN
jgi:hypothetical protein